MRWDDAACHGDSLDRWFPPGYGPEWVDELREVCAGCPLKLDCAEYALERSVHYGVWGGLTPQERSRIRKGNSTIQKEWSRFVRRQKVQRLEDTRAAHREAKTADVQVARRIIDECADDAQVLVEELLGPSRERRIVAARQTAMARCRAETCLSLADIGGLFDRDHSTVIHAVRKVPA